MCVILDKKRNMQIYSLLQSLHVNKHSLATNQSPISQCFVSYCNRNDLHLHVLLRYKYLNGKISGSCFRSLGFFKGINRLNNG